MGLRSGSAQPWWRRRKRREDSLLSPEQPRVPHVLQSVTSWQSPGVKEIAGGGSRSVKRFCLNAIGRHTSSPLLFQERGFYKELLHDNRSLINSLLFFWGQIILIKEG